MVDRQRIEFGTVIEARVLDPSGQNAKSRPLVVVNRPGDLATISHLSVVAVTTSLQEPLPPGCILLPWHPQGVAKTGLRRRCWAVCDWTAQIAFDEVDLIRGRVPRAQMVEIVAYLVNKGMWP
jgi:hypothetical protein